LAPAEIELNRRLEDEVRALRESGRSTELLLFGRRVESPVAVAAGPAPNALWLEFFSGLGYDLLTHKTVRDRYWAGHPLPNILNVEGDFRNGFRASDEFRGTITNSLGMPSADPGRWQGEVRKVLQRCREKFVAVSVTATVNGESSVGDAVEQFASLAGMVKGTGAHAVELNFSCPNVSTGEGEVYADQKLCGRIVDSVRQEVGGSYPLLLKTGFLDDYNLLVEETCSGPTGYVVINAIPAEVRGPAGELVFSDRGGKAGVAGKAIFGFTKKAVEGLQSIRADGGEFKIFAVGGITEPAHALELISSGADVVESATGALHDPALALRIKKALLERGPDN